jgi:WD40 repeat protein
VPDPPNRPTLLPIDGEPTAAPAEPSTGSGLEAIRTLLGTRPDTVPRYQIGETLGRGGMGEVYAAYDARLRRTIALKSLRLAEPGEDVVARFLREAQVTGQLEHPNVVPVYDIGLDALGRVFYTMKKVQGRSLAQLVRDGKAGRIGRLRIFLQICEAVAYAHDRGVVHRDLKPANVMLGEFGEVLVLDWGLAKRVGESAERPVHSGAGDESLSDLTRADIVMGTPSWMSPEQARKEPAHPAADQYALGAILYLLLTGRPPFKPGPAVIEQVKAGAFARPREVERDVPRALEAVVLKAMAGDPARRYPSVGALRDDITSFLEDRPVTAMRYTARDRVGRWAGRHWRAIVLTTGITASFGAVGLAAVALAAGIWSWGVAAARDVAVTSEKAATRQLAETRVALALVDVEARRPAAAAAKLDEARAAWSGLGEADPPLLALARSYLAWREDPPPLTWTGADFYTADVSADGRDVLAADQTGRFWWLDGVTGELRAELPSAGTRDGMLVSLAGATPRVGWITPAGPERALVWAALGADGRLSQTGSLPLAPQREEGDGAMLSADGSVSLITADRAQLYAVPGGEPVGVGVDGIWVVGFSPDLGRVVGRLRSNGSFLRSAVDLGVWDTRTGAQVWYQRAPGEGVLSEDGQLLAVLAGDPTTLRLVDLATGEVRWEVSEEFASNIAFLPSGTAVAAIGDERARVRSLADGQPVGWLPLGSGVAARFASGQGHVATGRRGRLEIRPWRPDRPDRALADVGQDAGVRAVDLSTDGHLLAFAGTDGRVRVMDADGGTVLRDLASNPCPRDDGGCGSRDVAFDDGGGRLAVADRDGRVRVWDLASSSVAWERDAGLGIVGGVDWSGDRLVSVHEDGSIVSWDPATGAERARLHADLTSSWVVALHPDGRRVIATGRGGGDPQLEVWDLETGKRTTVADQPGPCYRGALSPDGRHFAVGTPSQGVWLWDLDADPIAGSRVLAADETVLSVGWTGDGADLLVGWISGRLSVVDVARGVELVSLPLHQVGRPGSVQDVALRADGRMFTVGDDGRVVAFPLHPDDESTWEIPVGWRPDPASLARGGKRAAAWWDWERALALYDAAAAGGAEVSATDRGRVLRELGRSGEIVESAVVAEGMSPAVYPVWRGNVTDR